jgi:non-ribosomal peptide synthetase component E (peptide arylation enzyme)
MARAHSYNKVHRRSIEHLEPFLKQRGASVQQLPEKVEFVNDMPMTKVGKIDKKVLREDIRKRING